MITEEEWTTKYKRALLETNPVRQFACIEDARDAMNARIAQLTDTCAERHVIDRALDILGTIGMSRVPHDGNEA